MSVPGAGAGPSRGLGVGASEGTVLGTVAGVGATVCVADQNQWTNAICIIIFLLQAGCVYGSS